MHFEGSEEKDFFSLFPRLFGSRQTINQVFNDFHNFYDFLGSFVVTNGKIKNVSAAATKKCTITFDEIKVRSKSKSKSKFDFSISTFKSDEEE